MDKGGRGAHTGRCYVISLYNRTITTYLRYRYLHHYPLASTKLYCLVTEAGMGEQLALSYSIKVEWLGLKSVTCRSSAQCHNRPYIVQLNTCDTETSNEEANNW